MSIRIASIVIVASVTTFFALGCEQQQAPPEQGAAPPPNPEDFLPPSTVDQTPDADTAQPSEPVDGPSPDEIVAHDLTIAGIPLTVHAPAALSVQALGAKRAQLADPNEEMAFGFSTPQFPMPVALESWKSGRKIESKNGEFEVLEETETSVFAKRKNILGRTEYLFYVMHDLNGQLIEVTCSHPSQEQVNKMKKWAMTLARKD